MASTDSPVLVNGQIKIKDRMLILLVMAKGCQIANLEREGSTTWFYFFQEDAASIVHDFQFNVPIPLADARMFIIATTIFNQVTKELL